MGEERRFWQAPAGSAQCLVNSCIYNALKMSCGARAVLRPLSSLHLFIPQIKEAVNALSVISHPCC